MWNVPLPLPTRRQFLEAMVIAAAATTVAVPALATATTNVPLYAVIHDVRFAAGVAFAAEARRRGSAVRAICGEVHELWHDDLYHHWADRPMALAGMTTHNALFLLSMMGREAGMRVVYRAHHMLGMRNEEAEHVAFGPHHMLSRHPVLSGPEALWGRTAAEIVTAWPKTAAALRPSHSTLNQAERHAIGGDALVTWLMVPAQLHA